MGRVGKMNLPDKFDDHTLTHEDLIDRGCVCCTAEDHFGDTRSGYWLVGDGNGKGYGHFLGETVEAAAAAFQG